MVSELNDILARLEPSLAPLRGEPTELGGGITNRNYRVMLGESEYVIRRPGKDTELLGIDRSGERLANEAAARLGISPAVVAAFDDCLVTRFVACGELAAGELGARADELGRALRAFHDCDLQLPSRFAVPELLDDYAAIVLARGGALPGGYARTAAVATLICATLKQLRARPCHNDLLPGNVIRSREDDRVMFVDWEYAGMGDPRFDLGNLSVNNNFDDDADERLLRAYHGQEPDDSQRASLKLMRVLSDAREGAWGVVQAEVSELDFDFKGYAREHFERLHETAAQPQFRQWLAEAAQ
jgi:thiamine kinase-like enzyme